jgi:hypothetical protein
MQPVHRLRCKEAPSEAPDSDASSSGGGVDEDNHRSQRSTMPRPPGRPPPPPPPKRSGGQLHLFRGRRINELLRVRQPMGPS